MATNEDVDREERTMMRLRYWVDLTVSRLNRVRSREEGMLLIEETRKQVVQLCPDKAPVFELVLRPRFMRIMNEAVREREEERVSRISISSRQ
jgi:hypothetical protein